MMPIALIPCLPPPVAVQRQLDRPTPARPPRG